MNTVADGGGRRTGGRRRRDLVGAEPSHAMLTPCRMRITHRCAAGVARNVVRATAGKSCRKYP